MVVRSFQGWHQPIQSKFKWLFFLHLLCFQPFWLGLFFDGNHGAKDMTCELHDEVSAGSQFVTHLTGRILERLSLRTTPINTKAGRLP